MRRGIGDSESTRASRKVSEQRIEGRISCLLTSEGPCPPLTYFIAGEREVNGGGKEGELETKNARMKVFIGVQSVVDMSTLGYDRS